MAANGHEVSCWGDENLLKLECDDSCHITVNLLKFIKLYTLNGWFYGMWIIFQNCFYKNSFQKGHQGEKNITSSHKVHSHNK